MLISERCVFQFAALTLFKGLGLFRFIKGGNGLTCRPFLQFNENSVRHSHLAKFVRLF